MRNFLIYLFLVGFSTNQIYTQNAGTPEQRDQLLNSLIEKTLEREAWSADKLSCLNIDFKEQAEALRKEFRKADTDEKLYRALWKLSNLRKDRHLRVEAIEGGLEVELARKRAPIQFVPDFSKNEVSYFIGDYSKDFKSLSKKLPAIGDELIAINGILLKTHFEMMEPYIAYSEFNNLLWLYADHLNLFIPWLKDDFYKSSDEITYQLRDSNGSSYDLKLPFLEATNIQWSGFGKRTFPGFSKVFSRTNYDLYLRDEKPQIVLLAWKAFKYRALKKDLNELLQYAEENQLLDKGLVIDATHSVGGSGAPLLIKTFANKPFQTTWGNIRISDILVDFLYTRNRSSNLYKWLRTDVLSASQKGADYSENVPFKLRYFKKEERGIMSVQENRFTGETVCLFSSKRGSNLDQFAAMVIDNNLCPSIGMPTGGYSNTWEWKENIVLPGTNKKLVTFMWTIGQTIRPNGDILEGNPPVPSKVILLDQKNYSDYYDQLVNEAVQIILERG